MSNRTSQDDLLGGRDPEFLVRLEKHLDGQLRAEELELFERELKSDPLNRQAMVQMSMARRAVQEALAARAAAQTPAIETDDAAMVGQASSRSTARGAKNWRIRRWLASAAVILLVASLSLLIIRHNGQAPLQSHQESPPTPSFAQITNVSEPQWNGTSTPSVGDRLGIGTLKLQSGTAQLTFDNGVTLAMTGPAELDLQSPSQVYLRSGRIVPCVPPAGHGFTVLSPHGKLIDLGTEFAVGVDPASQTEVHVLTGEVRVSPSGSAPADTRSLTTGYSARLEPSTGQMRSRITEHPLLLDQFEGPDSAELNGGLSQRQQGTLSPMRYVSLDADALPVLRQGRLAIPFEGRKGRPDPVARVVLDHDLSELSGRRYTIAFKAKLPDKGSMAASHWLAFVLDDGQHSGVQPSLPLAYADETNFSLMLSPDWLVGLRVAGKAIAPKQVFPRSERYGPYQVMIRVDETGADGPRLDAEVNGVPIIKDLKVPPGTGRRIGFHTWVKEHSDARGWATIDDLCVSVESSIAEPPCAKATAGDHSRQITAR